MKVLAVMLVVLVGAGLFASSAAVASPAKGFGVEVVVAEVQAANSNEDDVEDIFYQVFFHIFRLMTF